MINEVYQIIMVRKVIDHPLHWLESSLNHSFVASIFRIDL